MKREFTQEEKNRLAGCLPFAEGATVPYTPEEFWKEREEIRPVYKLGPYSEATKVKRFEWKKEEGASLISHIRTCLQESGISGWENQFDLGTGEEVAFSKSAIARLPDQLIYKIDRICGTLAGIMESEKEGLGLSPQPAQALSSSTAGSANATP